MLLAMAIGVAAVVVLTSLGEGARRYVTDRFASLGSHLLIVIPGRAETRGGAPATLMGETPRDLTIADAMALLRSPHIRRIAPISLGGAPVSHGSRERDSAIIGTNADFLDIRHWSMAKGQFLPRGDDERAAPVCVIGATVRKELFGVQPALGEWLRIGQHRFRVIGILESEGHSIGVDTEELVMIPVAAAQTIFNNPSLFRIIIEAKSREAIANAKQDILNTISARHQGEKDVTVITQDAVLATFDRIFKALTMTVAGIAAISLAVAGILIMNVMLVAVTQRTSEIGLLKALGAPGRNILALFLSEAILLSSAGALAGMALGQLGSWLVRHFYPEVPAYAPGWAVLAALGIAIITGGVFSILPARRAARLDPVQALSRR
ncbi:MAG: ABC transporter permease [Pseudomonadota bacterium]|nr:MAG: ABC transporter permease [Pseudomonadota bacterium]